MSKFYLLLDKCKKPVIILLAMLSFLTVRPESGIAQSVNNYFFYKTNNNTYTPISGTTLLGTGQDDISSAVKNIGFNFVFGGVTYSKFSVSSNGALGLGSSIVYEGSNNSMSNLSTTSYPLITAAWDDFTTGSNGGVSYSLSGTAPNRILTVQWKVNNYSDYSSSPTTKAITKNFQVKLTESTNIIQLVYGQGANFPTHVYGYYDVGSSVGIASDAYHFQVVTTSNTFNNNIVHTDDDNDGYDQNAEWPGNFAGGTIFTFAPAALQPTITGFSPSNTCVGSVQNVIITGTNLTGTTSIKFGTTPATSFTVNSSTQITATTPVSLVAGSYIISVTAAGTTVNSTGTFTVFAPGTWLGTNSNWNDDNNWSCGAIPTSSTNVTIPDTQNDPEIPEGISEANNITIEQGASLTVLGTLQIAGTITNDGSFDATNGTLELNGQPGLTAQKISGSWFVNRTIQNLIISNTGGVSLSSTTNDTLNITGLVSFGKSNCTFNTNNNLTLKSTAEGTAGVADITNNGALRGNSIIGDVTVERYINIGNLPGQHNKTWIMLATPTQGKTIYQTWMENGNKTIKGYGTQITGNGTGFDAYSSAPALKYYKDVTNSWVGITNAYQPVYDSVGYLLFVRGDRSTGYPNISNTTLRTTGTLITGNSNPVSVKAGHFQSVGNPYASAVDLRKISATGINPDIIVWDPTLIIGNIYGVGAYQTLYKDGDNYRNLLPSTTFGPAGTINNNIESGVAFFVQSFDTDGQVYFTENSKVSTAGKGIAMREQTASDINSLNASLYVVNTDGSSYVADGAMEQFGAQYSNGIDGMDTRKISNSSENLSIKSNGKDLVVERRSFLTSTDTISYNLTGVSNHNYRFIFNASGISTSTVNGFVEDSYTKTETPLNPNGDTQVDFTVTSNAASKAVSRFHIVFRSLSAMPVTFTSVKATAKNNQIAVDWKVENQSNMKEYDVERSVDGNKFTQVAVIDANKNSASDYNWLDVNPARGNNYYRIRSVDLNGKTAYTSVVKAQISDILISINVYPNPAIDAKVSIQFNNQPEGVYYARLINPLGQVIVSKKIVHSAGSSAETIEWSQAAARGIYNLQITQPDGSVKVIKVAY